ncbi:hypothetical protein BCR36DRAFT_253372, partial [Piromyces finnis]
IELYFDKLIKNQKNPQKLFPLVFSKKDSILLNVIVNKETRTSIIELREKCNESQLLSKLSKNENICKMIISGELSDDIDLIKYIKMFNKTEGDNNEQIIQKLSKNENICKWIMNENLEDNSDLIKLFEVLITCDKFTIKKIIENAEYLDMFTYGKLNINNYMSFKMNKTKIVSTSIEGSITQFTKSSEKYDEETINKILNNPNIIDMIRSNELNDSILKDYKYYHDLFTTNEKTGYSGEAYIYELLMNLLRLGQLKSVEWKTLSKNGCGTKLDYHGKTYYLSPDGAHYDIVVETNNGRKIYIEVKSTKHSYNENKVPFFLSQKQIDMMNDIKYPNEYILAIVFDVFCNPKHFFMSLRNNVVENKICNDENHKYMIKMENEYEDDYLTKI